jgi:iron(III) transport system substrate-binding protein
MTRLVSDFIRKVVEWIVNGKTTVPYSPLAFYDQLQEVDEMPVLRVRWLNIVALIALTVCFDIKALQAQPVNIDAAKKEGKVIAYGTIIPQVMTPLHENFEKRYGIKVEYWRASATAVMERAMAEWEAGRPGFDVVFAIHGAQLLLKQASVFAKYMPPPAEKFPARFKDKDGILTAWRHTPVGTLYNTDLVKPVDAPKSLDDLLNPRWKGKIAMPDPSRHTSTAQFLVSLKKIKGDGWLDYVKALAKQAPLLTESFAPVPNDILRGEVALGLTYIAYVYQYKGPLGYVLMDKILTDSNDLGLSAKAANPNAAKLYMEYLCSPEGQKLAADLGEFVYYPGIYPPVKDADKVGANSIFMDNPSADEYKKLSAEFHQIFFQNNR